MAQAQRYKLADGTIVEAQPDGTFHEVTNQSIQTKPADPKLPYQVQSAAGDAAAAPYAAPLAGANLQRINEEVKSAPIQRENTQVNIEQSKAGIKNQQFNQNQGLRQEFNSLPEVKTYSEALNALGGALNAPNNPQGDLAVVYAFAKAMDPGSVVREGEMDMANQTASIVQRIQQQYGMIGNGKRLPPDVRIGLLDSARRKVEGMKPLYMQQYQRYSELAQQKGMSPAEVVGKPLYDAVRPLEEQYIKAHGGTPKIAGEPLEQGLATGKTRNQYDPKASAEMNAAVRAGVPYNRAAAMAAKYGYPAPDEATYNKAVQFAHDHPEYRKSLAEATRTVPTTAFQQFAASPAGAMLSGAAKAGTLGFADEAAAAITPGDYTQNRDAFAANQDILASQHQTMDFIGQMGGGIAAGAGMAAGLSKVPGMAGGLFGARTPLPGLLSREGIAGDAAFGGGYGAGTDNEDRLGGGIKGLGLGVGGGLAARGAVNGLASAISPTGGKMRAAYDMGVRPSIGQRAGGAVNFLEEKLQSLPGVGDAIRGTRDRAVDQFQLGLHNDGLRFIGEKLPEGTTPGFKANAHSQAAERKAYGQALSGMTARVDDEFGNDLAGVQQKHVALSEQDQGRFNGIWGQSVARRLRAGGNALQGEEYKAAESEIGSHIRRLSKNPANMDLVDTLMDAQNALRGSAFRHSPPEAVQALKNADSMHARLLRIEKASDNDIGEPGEFSPKSYAKQIRQEGGGVRNRNYLAGKALNSDLAAVGMRLGDKVSNSFTWDRAAVPVLAGAAGYMNPGALAGFAGYGALNAPGVRNVVTELMAPRSSPFFDRTADQLRQRARLAGMFGAPAAIDYYGGQ